MPNPLLEKNSLPPFSHIGSAHVEPAITQLIERNKQAIELLLAENEKYTWSTLWKPIEQLEDELAQAWSPVSHLNSVANSEELRTAYNTCLPLLSEYATWSGQHSGLYEAYRQIGEGEAFASLDSARQKAVTNVLRDFRLAGVALPQDQKEQFAELRKRLSELGSQFSDNVLDATNAWTMQVSAEQLTGLPETALANARQAAEQAGVEGYMITLEFPSYYPILAYCEDSSLREEVYRANSTRASDQGPHAGQWDNSQVMEETLGLRQELSQLLGFANYAELSLATKMAESPAQVSEFIEQLSQGGVARIAGICPRGIRCRNNQRLGCELLQRKTTRTAVSGIPGRHSPLSADKQSAARPVRSGRATVRSDRPGGRGIRQLPC